MDFLEQWMTEHKAMFTKAIEAFEKSADQVAKHLDICPVFSAAAPIIKLFLGKLENKEEAFMKAQFKKVGERLEEASEQLRLINKQIRKSFMDVTYFEVEENIINQFRKYMDIINAKPEFREQEKNEFLDHFDSTGRDKNLHTLFSAVTGTNFDSKSVLKITMEYKEKDRRAVEEFCARLKHLFCVGLIALMGRAALKDCGDEERLLTEWRGKMATVQKSMDAVIQDCIDSFPELAKKDAEQVVKDEWQVLQSSREDRAQRLAQAVLQKLKSRYDWVFWSVRVFKSPTLLKLMRWAPRLLRLLPGMREFHCPTEKNRLVAFSDDHLHVVVSYSASPEPVDRGRVEQLLSERRKLSVKATAEMLLRELPGDCAVHTIRTRELAMASSFSPEALYWEKHGRMHVCVHSA